MLRKLNKPFRKMGLSCDKVNRGPKKSGAHVFIYGKIHLSISFVSTAQETLRNVACGFTGE